MIHGSYKGPSGYEMEERPLTLPEFRLEAQEKNLKSAESYGKACKSLASCPVTYERPRELLCLAGIGAKTVEMLEKKWRAWCVENGRTVDPSPERESSTELKLTQGAKRPLDHDPLRLCLCLEAIWTCRRKRPRPANPKQPKPRLKLLKRTFLSRGLELTPSSLRSS